jgi:hypothetical protein
MLAAFDRTSYSTDMNDAKLLDMQSKIQEIGDEVLSVYPMRPETYLKTAAAILGQALGASQEEIAVVILRIVRAVE